MSLHASSSALDPLLAGYATGTLHPALHALLGSHLALKPDNRRFVAALEEAAAREMTALPPMPLSDGARRLDSILSAAVDQPAHPVVLQDDEVLPLPLRQFVGQPLRALRWRRLLPGVREAKVATVDGGEASFIWGRAGRKLPAHTHEGLEVTLILSGCLVDSGGRHGRGDITVADREIDHKPVVDAASDCLCFAVTDAPIRLTGPIGRLVDRVFRR